MDIVEKIKEFTLDGDGYNSEYNLMLLDAIETIESLRQQLAEQTSGEPVAYADVKFQHDKRWPPGISLHFIGGTGFGDLGKLGHGIHNLYTKPPSVEVLLEALRKLAKYPSSPKDEMSAWTMRNLASDALNAYSAKPITVEDHIG
jgi:hypothetical protein